MCPADEAVGREVRLVLDEEIARLPEKCRAAVVLCLLEGKTQEQAARLRRRTRHGEPDLRAAVRFCASLGLL